MHENNTRIKTHVVTREKAKARVKREPQKVKREKRGGDNDMDTNCSSRQDRRTPANARSRAHTPSHDAYDTPACKVSETDNGDDDDNTCGVLALDTTTTSRRRPKRKCGNTKLDPSSSSASSKSGYLDADVLSRVNRICASYNRLQLFSRFVLYRENTVRERNHMPFVHHAYVTTGPVVTSFEFRTEDALGPERVRPLRHGENGHLLRGAIDHSIDDMRMLLRVVADVDNIITAPFEAALLRSLPPYVAPSMLKAKARFEPLRSASTTAPAASQPTGMSAIASLLADVFASPDLRSLGCHFARREFDEGGGGTSFESLGAVLRNLSRDHTARWFHSEHSGVSLQLRVSRACLEGLRDPSKAEAHLMMSASSVAQLRRAFVRTALLANAAQEENVMNPVARTLCACAVKKDKLSPLSQDQDRVQGDALYILDRVVHEAVVAPSAAIGLQVLTHISRNLLLVLFKMMDEFSEMLYVAVSLGIPHRA